MFELGWTQVILGSVVGIFLTLAYYYGRGTGRIVGRQEGYDTGLNVMWGILCLHTASLNNEGIHRVNADLRLPPEFLTSVFEYQELVSEEDLAKLRDDPDAHAMPIIVRLMGTRKMRGYVFEDEDK